MNRKAVVRSPKAEGRRWKSEGAQAVAANKRMGRPVAVDLTKGEGTRWHEAINPLRGLTVTRATSIFDNARLGCYADLMWLYNEIEAADPTLFICAERRAAGVEELDWAIVSKQSGRVGAAWDDVLAAEQSAYLEAAYGACDNLLDGTEALATAFFRGFAHILPIYAADGQSLARVERLDGWNFAWNRQTLRWHWNPEAFSAAAVDKLQEVPDAETARIVRPRHIDYPALTIYIRAALGEKQWGLFMERYGIPPVTIVMPEFADSGDEARYLEAAQRMAKAGSGALPYGSTVTYATEARGVNPFDAYLKHQQELVVLLATGGLATSLAMPAGLGEGASGQHGDTWRTIVRRDARILAQAFNRRITADLLAAAYPGRPALAEFAFETEATPSAAEVFEAGSKAVTAGYRIVQADLEDKSGYKLEPAAATPAEAGGQRTEAGPAPDGSVDAAAAAGEIQQASLNGAQVQALQQILADVSARQLPPESASEMLAAAFPLLAPERIARMVGSAAQFVPAPVPVAANKAGDAGQKAEGAIEAAAVEALAEARAKGLAPVIDRLLDALAETDEAAMRERLAALLADLPKLAGAAQASAEDAALMERILSDAVGAGMAGRASSVERRATGATKP